MTDELYKRYRPVKFSDVIGQDEAVKTLTEMGRKGTIPHAILFSGPSGCGKTTLARILKEKLKCGDKDFCELNAADDKGIDVIREIRSHSGLSAISGACRIWLIDECANLTPQAQESFLKQLEDTPKHVYFFLATTDPQKLKKTIITRCTEVRVKLLKPADMRKVVERVLAAENKEIESDVVEKIVEIADGSARKALVLLHQVIDLANEGEQLEALQKSDVKNQSIEIARLLMDGRTKWSDLAKVIKTVEDEPETIRRIILGYFTAVALNKPDPRREVQVLECFLDPYFNTAKAGLVQSCYVALMARSGK